MSELDSAALREKKLDKFISSASIIEPENINESLIKGEVAYKHLLREIESKLLKQGGSKKINNKTHRDQNNAGLQVRKTT